MLPAELHPWTVLILFLEDQDFTLNLAGLKFVAVLLPQPPKHWQDRHSPPGPPHLLAFYPQPISVNVDFCVLGVC